MLLIFFTEIYGIGFIDIITGATLISEKSLVQKSVTIKSFEI